MERDNLRGSLLMVFAMAVFAMEDMFLKWSSAGLPTGQILLASGLFGWAVFAAMARRDGRRTWTRDAFHPAVMWRNAGEMVGTYAYITAIASVPLATVSAVLQAMPLAVTLGAALFLGEQVGWRRWTAICVGFLGVLLVIRPGMAGFEANLLWVLVTVPALAVRDLASRRVPAGYSNAQVSAWGLMAVSLLGASMLVVGPQPVWPTVWQGSVLLGALFFGTTGYWAITAATRTGEVSIVAPYRYTRLIFAILIGAFVFAEWPDRMTLIGASLIIGAGLYSFLRERARLQQARALSMLAR
jgi:drug/metabolite transporter (DMT)-like permease